MNIIEWLIFISPAIFNVVDDELKVWGNNIRLDGAQVVADDLSRWVLVRKVNGPDSGTRAYINDSLNAALDGREM